MIQILPAIDIIDSKCVRLSQGDYNQCTVYECSPVEMAHRYVDAGLNRIHVVDLDGAKSAQPENIKALEQMASVPGAQIEWGGGIKSRQALDDIFNAGASFAVIGSLAAKQPNTMIEWIRDFGPDRMVLGADVRNGRISVNGWLEDTDDTIAGLINKFTPVGLKQVICTEISRDGMFTGPAFDLYADLMNQFPDMIFTASGGISCMNDIIELDRMGMSRVIVGKALYEGRISLKDLEDYQKA